MMSPYLQRPLDLGVDIVRASLFDYTRLRQKQRNLTLLSNGLSQRQVYDSATKYLSGHHDLMAGAITARTEDVGKRLAWFVNAMGTGLPPFDCFLLLRGRESIHFHLIITFLPPTNDPDALSWCSRIFCQSRRSRSGWTASKPTATSSQPTCTRSASPSTTQASKQIPATPSTSHKRRVQARS